MDRLRNENPLSKLTLSLDWHVFITVQRFTLQIQIDNLSKPGKSQEFRQLFSASPSP